MHRDLERQITGEIFQLASRIASTLTQSGNPGDSSIQPRSKEECLLHYRKRLLLLDCGLTAREIDVCARSLSGMTATGTALDLGVKTSSVVTYRKRAYERLRISSQHELFRLVS